MQEDIQKPGIFYKWYRSMPLGYSIEKLHRKIDLFFQKHGVDVTIHDIIKIFERWQSIAPTLAEPLFFCLMTNTYFLQNTQLFNSFCSYCINTSPNYNFSIYIPQRHVQYLCDTAASDKKKKKIFCRFRTFFY